MMGHRQVLLMAGPIILSNMTVPLVGMVDTAVVGHLPNPAFIGAVALGAAVFSFVFWNFGFLRMGTTGFVAQAQGKGDEREIRTILIRSLYLAAFLGMLLVVLQVLIIHIALIIIDTTPELETLTKEYIQIRIWSAPATLMNYALIGVFIGLQRSLLVLLLQLQLNLINMGLDVLFVMGFGWDVAGVALASVLSEYSALLVGLILLRRELWTKDTTLYPLWDSRQILALLSVNSNIFIRTLCLNITYLYFTATSARFGPTVLAANAILLHFLNLMAFGLDGFAHAAEALVGSAYGARRKEQFIRAIRLSTLWALVTALLYSLVYAIWGTDIIALMTHHTPVQTIAAQYLPWLLLIPLLAVWPFQLDGIFIGTTRAAEMRNAALIGLILYIPLLEVLVWQWGNHGLWLAMAFSMLLRAGCLLIYFPRLYNYLR